MTAPTPDTVTETETDVELAPSEYLMMEVLAARARLGEHHWTFPKPTSSIARRLEAKNLVSWKSGVAQDTITVALSELGRTLWLSAPYSPPSGMVVVPRATLRRLELEHELRALELAEPTAVVHEASAPRAATEPVADTEQSDLVSRIHHGASADPSHWLDGSCSALHQN